MGCVLQWVQGLSPSKKGIARAGRIGERKIGKRLLTTQADCPVLPAAITFDAPNAHCN